MRTPSISVRLAFGLALFLFALPATAGPVSYWVIDSPDQIGFFTVDDAILSQTGTNLIGTLSAFRFELTFSLPPSPIVWDMNDPNSEFAGFRGPHPGGGNGFGADAPGFDVAGGEVVGLRGGVYSGSDIGTCQRSETPRVRV